jgi:putative cardiolipin synthase
LPKYPYLIGSLALGLSACSLLGIRSADLDNGPFARAPSSAGGPIAPFYQRSKALHHVQVIDDGVSALEKRIEMIEQARSRIDVEYFIYNNDDAGHLFTEALIAKKRANKAMQIRVLVDASALVVKLVGAPVHELAKWGIPVRYYNKDSSLFKSGHRNHRKLLATDTANGPAAMTGGRNIADEYFDMSPRFNFLDRDIYVEGPVAETMHATFDRYWDSPNSTPAPTALPEEPSRTEADETPSGDRAFMERLEAYRADIEWANSLERPGAHFQRLLKQVRTIGAQRLAAQESQGECNDLAIVTDEPNIEGQGRYTYQSVLGQLKQLRAGQTFTLESPYFIPADGNEKALFDSLPERKVKVSLLTNSLASTDAFYVAAHFIPRKDQYKSFGDIYTYSGNSPKQDRWLLGENGKPFANAAVWGIHAKTFIFGDDTFAIGTFNADPRSANINSEMLVYCTGSPTLTGYVTKLVHQRMQQSDSLMRDGKVNTVVAEHQVGFLKRIEFFFSLLPSSLAESQM